MLVAIAAYPIFYGVRTSVTRYRYGHSFGFYGLGNYRDIWNDGHFRTSLEVTGKFVLAAVVIETILGLCLALLVNRQIRFPAVIRMTIIVPMTIAPVVVGVIWQLMYSSDAGIINPLFAWMHGIAYHDIPFVGHWLARQVQPPGVLDHHNTAFWGLVMMDVWEWTPLLFLILLAGLQGLPQEPLEAARVDGAGRARVFIDHTLPLLRPVLLVAIVLRTIDAVGTFDQIYVLTKGGPGESTNLISYYAYNTYFSSSLYGLGAAMVIVVLLAVLILAAIVITLMRRSVGAGAPA